MGELPELLNAAPLGEPVPLPVGELPAPLLVGVRAPPGLLVAAPVQDRFFIGGRTPFVQSTHWPPRASCCCSSPEPGWWPDPCDLVHHLASSGFLLLLLWERLPPALMCALWEAPAVPFLSMSEPIIFMCEPISGSTPWDAPAVPFLSMSEPIIFMCEPISGSTPSDAPAIPFLSMGEPIIFMSEPISGSAPWDAPAVPFLSVGEPIIFMCAPASPIEVSTTSLHLFVSEPIIGLNPGGSPASLLILIMGEPILFFGEPILVIGEPVLLWANPSILSEAIQLLLCEPINGLRLEPSLALGAWPEGEGWGKARPQQFLDPEPELELVL